MAAPSLVAVTPASETEEGDFGTKPKSPAVTPQKIRELIDGGIAPEETNLEGKDSSAFHEVANGSPQTDDLPFEGTSKEAFFSRVETFTSLKWAGKPHELSPLICARYGWTNVECDMLKCASCQAYLCASLQLAFDFSKYKERCSELRRALSEAHEKFCFWPDSPCPDRFSVLLVNEPLALFGDFLERFQSLCHLEHQLPSLKPEDLKNMSLSEEKISRLLQLIEEEAGCKTESEKTPGKHAPDLLPIHVTACVLALCGWTSRYVGRRHESKDQFIHRIPCTTKIDALLDAHLRHLFPETMAVGKRYSAAPRSLHVKIGGWGNIRDHELCKSYRRLHPSLGSVHLPLIACSHCMRKVGLWSFLQIESALPETEPPPTQTSPSTTPVDGRPDKVAAVPTSPRRMITRSQDTTFPPGPDQLERSPCPGLSRVRSCDGITSGDRGEADAVSPTTRSRPVTRSMGQGDGCGLGTDVTSSPHRRAKRARLCSTSSSDSSSRTFFDPVAQHRDWCPWVNAVKETAPVAAGGEGAEGKADLGWQAVLRVLQASRPTEGPVEKESSSLSEKSCKVFRIFRQWEAASSSSGP